MLRFLLDIIFPLHCFGCGASHTYLCDACRNAIPPAPTSPHAHITAVFAYRDPLMRKLIWHLKYRGKFPIAEPLSRALYDALLEVVSEHRQFYPGSSFILVPIPLSKKRLRARGYNQAAYIARALTDINPSLFTLDTKALTRTRDTQSQTDVTDKHRRKANVRGAFTVTNPALVAGKDIMLIDDVTTTGATLLEARKTLLAAGARTVLCVAVAH